MGSNPTDDAPGPPGPDFGDPEPSPRARPAAPRPSPAPTPAPAYDLPAFEDAPAPEPVPEAPAPQAPPAPAANPRAARIAAVVVILAILGILLALFMPRERPEGTLQTGAAPGPAVTAPTPTPAPVQSAQLGAADRTRPEASVPAEVPRGDRLFSQGEAGAVLKSAEGIEKSQRDAVLALMIALLREPQYQSPEDFAILTATLGTVGLSMIPGGPTEGHHEIIDTICASRTGLEAAQKLESMQYQSPFSLAVQQGLLGVLSSATTFGGFMEGLDKVQRDNGIELAPDTITELQRQAQTAAGRRGQSTQPTTPTPR